MKITVIGRKCTPRDSFKQRAEKRLKKVEKFFDSEAEAKITATVEKNEQIVEVTIFYNGMFYRSQERAVNMNDALDRCVDSLVRQIRKNKTRLARRLRQDAFTRTVEETSFIPQAEEDDVSITKVKQFYMRPLTREEAVMQMNLLNHNFFAFRDEDNGGTFAVVYKRNDGGYGLLDDTE